MKAPKWVSAIKHNSNSHGSGILQKKLWKLVSDYTRIRDWYQYNKRCVASGDYIEHWSYGDPGHFIPWSVSHGMFKFDIWNIHLQSKNSNAWGGANDGERFAKELQRRYGDGFIEELRVENRNHMGEKLSTDLIVQEMADILELMKTLPEQPDYFERVMNLKNELI